MTHSLNEIEAIAKRAARGSGLSWGLAEEAAKGTRWLSAFDLPGAELLAQLLVQNDRIPQIDVSPVSLSAEVWHAPMRRMSPLIAGASLSDCAQSLLSRGQIIMEDVSFPLLAVPFMGGASLRLGVPVAASWDDAHFVTDGKLLCVNAAQTALAVDRANTITFSTPAEMSGPREPVLRASVSSGAWSQLAAFAHRTYAPATEESRRLGAGAGLGDND
ncbi:DUF3726 domain-containing protein [Shimia abyssi]|uniref:Uncharacterized protein DUF3726 n=1 Tax=Shimia abyssi TaxID=1662395 RepID=A0A2P8F071_9RHOB|nr:DUF3726 domain-containing protein [Shimia abyssi]PSL15096.1 uncharacterized protein DUF3726 [Shimia abyssi]